MYKLLLLSTLLALATAAPKPSLVYSSPILTPVSPHVVTSVVSPGVASYSSYSNSVVHGSPVVAVPVVHQAPVAHVVPVLQKASFVRAWPYAYPEHVVVA